jgi:branched-chain amino acid transport system ATP-binding protein
MTAAVLELRGIAMSFGNARILSDVELAVAGGERHAIIGPNGAGKSTLFNLVSGLLRPTAGSIHLKGERVDGLDPERLSRKGLARSFQITSVFPRLSVFENLRLGVMARRGIRFDIWRPIAARRALNEETEALLHKVGLGLRRDTPAGDLTYSEQRALEIGMTLATGADVILLDEPTAGMSRDETKRAVELMREVTEGKTLVVVEHDMDVVFSLCDRVSVLVYGEILATGTPEAIRADPRVQEAYLGEMH